MDAYAMYTNGATIEETGEAFGIGPERIRQLFRAEGLPLRPRPATTGNRKPRETPANAKRLAAKRQRTMDAYAIYMDGATLEEVGEALGVTRERVRQLFREEELPVRTHSAAADNRRERQFSENKVEIRAAFEQLGDVDAVIEQLSLPEWLVKEVLRDQLPRRRKRKATPKQYSDEELMGFLQGASAAIGGVLSTKAYTKYARTQVTTDGRPWPTHQTHMLRFGSWRNAVQAAGLAANPSSPIAGQTLFEAGHCIDALRAAARSLGKVPTASEYDQFAQRSRGALPSAATVRHKLGLWNAALDAAGL